MKEGIYLVLDSREIKSEDIGSFIEHMSKHKNVYGVDIRFNPFIANVIIKDHDLESTNSVIDWYIDWQGEHTDTTYFDIEIG